jgi:hypothetical protein
MDEPRRAIRQECFLHGRVDLNNGRKPMNCRIHNIRHEERGCCSAAPANPLPDSAASAGVRTRQNGAHSQEQKS